MPWLAATAFLHSVMIQEKRGMLKVWNVLLVVLAFCLALFGTFLTRSGVVSSIHSFTQSPLGPWFLGFIASSPASLALDLLAAAAPALEDAAGVARLARGDVPLQQPAARRALPDDPLGRRRSRSCPRPCTASRSRSSRPYYNFFLRVVRAAAPGADGDRPARRLAARVPALPRPELRLAGRARSRRRRRPARPRRRLVVDRPRRVHVLARSCSGRSATSSCAGPGRAGRWRADPGSARSSSSSAGTGAATAATSSMPRSSCWRSASSARARTTRFASGRSRPASRCAISHYVVKYDQLVRARRPERDRVPRASWT